MPPKKGDWKDQKTKDNKKDMVPHANDPKLQGNIDDINSWHHKVSKSLLSEIFNAAEDAAYRLNDNDALEFVNNAISEKKLKNVPQNLSAGVRPEDRSDDPGNGMDLHKDNTGNLTPRSKAGEDLVIAYNQGKNPNWKDATQALKTLKSIDQGDSLAQYLRSIRSYEPDPNDPNKKRKRNRTPSPMPPHLNTTSGKGVGATTTTTTTTPPAPGPAITTPPVSTPAATPGTTTTTATTSTAPAPGPAITTPSVSTPAATPAPTSTTSIAALRKRSLTPPTPPSGKRQKTNKP